MPAESRPEKTAVTLIEEIDRSMVVEFGRVLFDNWIGRKRDVGGGGLRAVEWRSSGCHFAAHEIRPTARLILSSLFSS
jgi:hypothetical protein